jgi:hypothetical protein
MWSSPGRLARSVGRILPSWPGEGQGILAPRHGHGRRGPPVDGARPEKLQRWTDCDGDLKQSLSRDDVLTDVTNYWVTGSINASLWPYYDRPHRGWPFPDGRIDLPTGYAEFPREFLHPRRVWAERAFDLRRWTRTPRGGQFAALEAPDLLADDVRAFFRPLRCR